MVITIFTASGVELKLFEDILTMDVNSISQCFNLSLLSIVQYYNVKPYCLLLFLFGVSGYDKHTVEW